MKGQKVVVGGQWSERQGLGVSLFFLLVTGPWSLTPVVHAEVVDRVVAVVNEDIITMSELNTATQLALQDLKKGRRERDVVEIRSKILDQLIERKLVEQASNKAGVSVSEKEIDNAIEDVKQENSLTQEDLLRALANSSLTYSEYRNQLKEQIRQVKFINKVFRTRVDVSEDDMEAYYRQNIERFYGPGEVRLKHIFLPVEKWASISQRRETEERARMILDEIKKGMDFVRLAITYSKGPNPEGGGDLGYIKVGEIDPAIKKVVLGLKVGEVSGIIETPSGFHIIQLVDRKGGDPRPFQEVREVIKDILFQRIVDERYRLWLEEQMRVSYIEVRL